MKTQISKHLTAKGNISVFRLRAHEWFHIFCLWNIYHKESKESSTILWRRKCEESWKSWLTKFETRIEPYFQQQLLPPLHECLLTIWTSFLLHPMCLLQGLLYPSRCRRGHLLSLSKHREDNRYCCYSHYYQGKNHLCCEAPRIQRMLREPLTNLVYLRWVKIVDLQIVLPKVSM